MNFQKLCWKLTDWRKIKKVNVEFKLITDSGHTIMIISRYMPIKNLVPIFDDWVGRREKEIDLSEKNRDLFNKIAKKELIKHQKRKIQPLKAGKCYSGKFIVKCVWEISLELEPMTFEEYKKAVKIIREEKRKKKEKSEK
jgi:hypothetical protein